MFPDNKNKKIAQGMGSMRSVRRATRYEKARYTPNKVTRKEQLPKWLVEQEAKKVSNEQVEDSEVALTDEMNERFQAYLKRKEGE